MLVRKAYPKIRKRQKARIWKLQHLDKEALLENNIHDGKKKKKDRGAAEQAEERMRQDYDDFLQDIEEDPEMRQNINLYKDQDVIDELEKQLAGMSLSETPAETDGKSPIDQALEKG